MSEQDGLEASIMEFFHKKNKMLASRDVAKGLGMKHSEVRPALTKLINEGKLEFVSFGGTTFIQLPQ